MKTFYCINLINNGRYKVEPFHDSLLTYFWNFLPHYPSLNIFPHNTIILLW